MIGGLQLWEVACRIAGLLAVLYLRRTSKLPLPPGPRGSLIFGNARQMPKLVPWEIYHQWSKQYGPLLYLRVLTRNIVILNTNSAALDLLEKRSSIYSDRPQPYFVGELAGRKLSVFHITSEHERFRKYRRMLHAELNPRVIPEYKQLMEDEARSFLKGLLETPERFTRLIRMNAAAIIMKLAYGYTVRSDDDYFITTIEEAFAISAQATHGFWLVDYFPILRFVPSWFPRGGFKRKGKAIGIELDKLGGIPHHWAKEQMAKGDFVESFTSRAFQSKNGELSSEEEDTVQFVASALYAGGGDTVVSSLTTFFFVMSLYPDVQRRAQAEIDAVIGRDRLPVLEDFQRSELTYVNALIKEVFRWHPVAPLGLPHRVTKEDTYGGYRIPAGSVVIANIWAMMHDETIYPNPHVFDPERHLLPAGIVDQSTLPPDPTNFIFGFGRRVCPGANFAQASLFLAVTSILSTFNIAKALDQDGKEIEPRIELTTAVTSHIKSFGCRITPRVDAEMLIFKP